MKKTDNMKAVKHEFEIRDCTKVMGHIQKDTVGVEPKKWVTKNRLGSTTKCHQALL